MVAELRSAGEKPAAAAEALNAPLFHSLIQRLESGGRWIVLDLGAARSETIRTFGRFRCRLDICDLADGLEARDRLHRVRAGQPEARREGFPLGVERSVADDERVAVRRTARDDGEVGGGFPTELLADGADVARAEFPHRGGATCAAARASACSRSDVPRSTGGTS